MLAKPAMELPGSSAQEVSAAILPTAKMTLSYSSRCEAEGAVLVLADGGLRRQWLLSTLGPYWEEGYPGFSPLAAGLEEAMCCLVVAAIYLLGGTGLGTHFPRPCMGSDSCAPSWREGGGVVAAVGNASLADDE